MSLEKELQVFLAKEEKRKTSMGKPSQSLLPEGFERTRSFRDQSSSILQAQEPPQEELADVNWAQEVGGNLLWSFMDEASLGILGMVEEKQPMVLSDALNENLSYIRDTLSGEQETGIDPETGEPMLFRAGPKTTAGKAAAGVGTLAGFIAGGPAMALKGISKGITKGASLLAGKETVQSAFKKAGKEAVEVLDNDIHKMFQKKLHSNIGQKVQKTYKPGYKNAPGEYLPYIQTSIGESIEAGVKSGIITPKVGEQLGKVYTKYLTDRPLSSVTDFFTASMQNKKIAYGIGAMLQEGMMFGILDGAREGLHVGISGGEHEYDLSHPKWGAIVGVAFGMGKFLPSAGKGSLGKVDFISAIKGKLAKHSNILSKQSSPELRHSATMLGANLKPLGLNIRDITYAGQKYKFDLSNPAVETKRIITDSGRAITEELEAELLRNVFGQTANGIGNQLVKWASLNSWASVKENWPKMLWGGLAMNARSFYDMGIGNMDVPNDDLAINFLLGAFLNRKGLPRKTDMFPEQLTRLREGLHVLEILPSSYTVTNPISNIPTLDPRMSSNLNPYASDSKLNAIVKLAENKGLTTNNFDSIDTPIEIPVNKSGNVVKFDLQPGAKSVKQSSMDLSLFDRFYNYLHGASNKRYVKNLDSISETTAKEINDALKVEFKDAGKLQRHLKTVADSVGDRFEVEIVKTAIDLVELLEGKQLRATSADGSIGSIPSIVAIHSKFHALAKDGKLGSTIDFFSNVKPEEQLNKLYELQQKVNTILEANIELQRATKRSENQFVEVTDSALLEALARTISSKELAINTELGLNSTANNSFNFNKVNDLMSYMSNRIVNKRITKFSKLFDTNSPKYKEVQSLLIDAGILRSDTADLKVGLKMIESINQIKFTDANNKVIKDTSIVSQDKLFISSLLEIIGTKNQYPTTRVGDVFISQDKIAKLKGMFNQMGVNVDSNVMSEFASQIIQRVTYENFKNSKLTPEQKSVFEAFYQLGSPTQGKRFSLMEWYKPADKKATGIMVHKIKYEGTDAELIKIANEYNNFVKSMKENGKIEGRDNIVSEGDTFTLNDSNTFLVIKSVMQDAIAGSNHRASYELQTYFQTVAGNETGRNAALTFLSNYPNKASKLTRLLISTGALEMKRGSGKEEGTYQYQVNQEVWAKNKTQEQLKRFIEDYGINLDSLEMKTTQAQEQVDMLRNEMDNISGNRSNLPLPEFFEKYQIKNDIDALVPPNPLEMTEFLNSKLKNDLGEFRGSKGILELYNSMTIEPGQSSKAYERLMQVVSKHIDSKTQKVYYFSNGRVESKDSNLHSYVTPYYSLLDKLKIPYALVDGVSVDWHFGGYKPHMKIMDIFQSESTIINKHEKSLIQNRKNMFIDLLKKKTNMENFPSGVELIEMPGMKLSLLIGKDVEVINSIKSEFNELVKRNIDKVKNTDAEDLLRTVQKNLEKTTEFNDEIKQVFRAIIAENMASGKDKSLFPDMLNMSEVDLNKFFVNRQTLFNSSKFQRLNNEVLDGMINSYSSINKKAQSLDGIDLNRSGYEAAKKYANPMKRKAGIVVINDAADNLGYSLKEMWAKQNKGKDWNDYYGDRLNESGYDSITYISKDFADMLSFYYGTPNAKVFKPVISSQGADNLMYGKTAFMYDPKLDGFFKSNKDIDILMMGSADKLKVSGDRALDIKADDVYQMGKVNNKNIINVPLKGIGIQSIPDKKTPAKLSGSIINQSTDIDIANRIYNDYFGPELSKNILKIREILNDPFVENEFLRQIKEGMHKGTFESQEMMDGADYHLGSQLEWLKLSPYASLDVFGNHSKLNMLKSKYIDTALAPLSEYKNPNNGEIITYGGKSVIGQKFDTALEGTLFNNKTNKIERYGEILLTDNVSDGSINFVGRNFDVRVINTKTNKVSKAKDVFTEIMKKQKMSDKDIESGWEFMTQGESVKPLESLFNFFNTETLNGVRHDIAISTLRYPRTRPNDLHLLRLRGFVKNSGQLTIVNPLDVYNIFEGDYDIDKVDFFWAGSDAWYENIARQQRVFVPTADVQGAKETLPNINLLSRNAKANNGQWDVLNSNQRAIGNLRGVVQATSAKVKYIDNIAAPIKDSQGNIRKVLLRNPDVKEGENGYWEVRMDWDNADYHLSQALTGQILLDATSPDPRILRTTSNWMTDFLFPKYSDPNSVSKDSFKNSDGSNNTNNLRLFINQKKSGNIEGRDKRVRLFRRFEYVREGNEVIQREVDMSELDIQHIKTLMNKFSKVLEVQPGRKVHTNGEAKKASYEQMVEAGDAYFNFADRNNFSNYMFKEMWRSKYYDGNTGEGAYQFQSGTGMRELSSYYAYKRPFTMKTNAQGVQYKKTNYTYSPYATKSPFPDGVINNMHRISRGESGSVAERALYEVSKDPLNKLHKETNILTNEVRLQERKLAEEILNNEDFNVSEMNNFMPAFLGEIKKDINTVKRLGYLMYKLNNSRIRNKKARLAELNKQKEELTEKLRPLLKKEFYKTRSAKDILFPETIDIQSDRNYVDGTATLYTLNYARSIFGDMNTRPGYKNSVREARLMVAKEYGYLNELHGMGYKNRSIHSTETDRILSNTKTMADIETRIHETITRNVNEHGITWLWDFALPSVADRSNYIGVYKNNAVPMAIKAGGNYKRAIRWMLDAHAGKLPEGFYATYGGKFTKDTFTTILQNLAEVDFTYRNYFSGKGKHLPADVFELNKLLTYGAPKFDWKLNNMFNKYTDIKATKHIDEFNPFGMGRRYGQQIDFFRQLSNMHENITGEQFEKGAGILSYTNQLMMENGFLSPQKALALMANATDQLGPMLNKVYPAAIDVKTGAAQIIRPNMINNNLLVLTGGNGNGGSNISLNPYQAQSAFVRNKQKSMLRQTRDMLDVNEDVFKKEYFETNQVEDFTTKPGEC